MMPAQAITEPNGLALEPLMKNLAIILTFLGAVAGPASALPGMDLPRLDWPTVPASSCASTASGTLVTCSTKG
jgi:hypothetical protein